MTFDKIEKRNQAIIAGLEKDFGKRVMLWVAANKKIGIILLLYSGRRSLREQAILYNKYLAGGPLAAKPGESFHNYGLAVDYVPMILTKFGYKESWTADKEYSKAQVIGLDFKLKAINKEKAHIQDGRYKSWRDIPR